MNKMGIECNDNIDNKNETVHFISVYMKKFQIIYVFNICIQFMCLIYLKTKKYFCFFFYHIIFLIIFIYRIFIFTPDNL